MAAIIIRRIPRLTVRVAGASAPIVASAPADVVVIEMGLTGRPGPPGPAGSNVFPAVAGEALSALRCVRVGSDERIYAANPATLGGVSPLVGVTLQAGGDGAALNVHRFGFLTDPAFAFTPGATLYCGTSGVIQSDPPAGVIVVVGWAMTATSIYFRIEPPIL